MNEILPSETIQTGAEALKIKPRHYELARAEQAMRRINGRYLTIEDILRRNGFASDKRAQLKAKGNKKEDLTMQALRLYVSSANQSAMGVCLLELRDSVLKIAVGDRLDDADLVRITNSLHRSHHEVQRSRSSRGTAPSWHVDARAKRNGRRTLVAYPVFLVERPPTTRCWLNRRSTIYLPKQRNRTSDIHLTLQEDDARCWVRYRVDGDLMYKHLVPNRVMAPIVTRIKTDAKMDAADRQHPQDGRLGFQIARAHSRRSLRGAPGSAVRRETDLTSSRP